MPQVRLNRTPELDKVLAYLRGKYRLLSEAEIIKVALSEKYYKEIQESSQKEQQLKKAYTHLMSEGKKLGNKLLAKRGLKRESMSEEHFYNLVLNPQND